MTRQLTIAAVSCAALLSAGCTVGPDYRRPVVPPPPAYKETTPPPALPQGEWRPAQPADAQLKGKWWEMYNDPRLNQLEEKIAVSNETLKAATEQYLSARAAVQTYRANFFPTLVAGPQASRQRLSINRPIYFNGARTQFYDYVLQGQANWEPDLWGNVRRTVESARAQAQARAGDMANVALSLQAELALNYFEMRGMDAQKQLLDSTVTAYTNYLKLTQIRFAGGLATQSDVALAETQLESTRAQAVDVAVARTQYEHAIATLTGQPASIFSLPPMPLTGTPPNIPAGMPSELLERRPDVSAAERRADAANAQIGVAVSAYYPRVTLTGAGGFESRNPGTWLQGSSELWSLGGSAVETLFDAGRRHALTQEARHNYEATAADYRQTVLNAFQEVEDNLAALRILYQESGTQGAAVAAAQRSLEISTNRYKRGLAAYLEVITAQTAQLINERTQADITTRQFAASVQLVRALGGGWTAAQLPNP